MRLLNLAAPVSATEDTGSIVRANTPEEFAAQIRAECDVYKRVVAQQKSTVE